MVIAWHYWNIADLAAIICNTCTCAFVWTFQRKDADLLHSSSVFFFFFQYILHLIVLQHIKLLSIFQVHNVGFAFELMQDAGLPKPKSRAEGEFRNWSWRKHQIVKLLLSDKVIANDSQQVSVSLVVQKPGLWSLAAFRYPLVPD